MQTTENRHHPLYHPLAGIVGSKFVADEDFAVYAYSRDAGAFPGIVPGVVVRPGSIDEVSMIVKLANRHSVPIVPRGGGDALFGPPPGEAGRSIVIDLTRINRIKTLDPDNMLVTAECGITTSELETKVREKGMWVPTIWMPAHATTLGGILAGSFGGGGGLGFNSIGMNWRYVLGLKVVLPTGEIVETGGGPGTNVHQPITFIREGGSFDLTGMFIGDGGTFGIKVEATLQAFSPPAAHRTGNYLFSDFEGMWRAMSRLMGIVPHPYAFPYKCIFGLSPETMMMVIREPVWGLLYSTYGLNEAEAQSRLELIEGVCREAGGKAGPEGVSRVTEEMAVTGIGMREMGRWVSIGNIASFETVYPKAQFPAYYMRCREFVNERHRRIVEKHPQGAIRSDMIIPSQQNFIFSGTNMYYDGSIHEVEEMICEGQKDFMRWAAHQGAFTWGHQSFGSQVLSSNWSPAFSKLAHTLKRSLDPQNIMNPSLWSM